MRLTPSCVCVRPLLCAGSGARPGDAPGLGWSRTQGGCAWSAGSRAGAESSPLQGGSSSGPSAPPEEIWVLRKPFAGRWGPLEGRGGSPSAGPALADDAPSCWQAGTVVAA